MSNKQLIPVITIDGLSGSGKGTLMRHLAKVLGWHSLDSGAIYRAVGWALSQLPSLDLQDTNELQAAISRLNIHFEHAGDHSLIVVCNGQDVSHAIRTETSSTMASKISAIPIVRESLIGLQRQFRQSPGLIADGRDMGTVIFPDAPLKCYLTARQEIRAERRYQQLQAQGISGNLREIQASIAKRDQRDQQRDVSPAKPAADAITIDTSDTQVEEILQQVLSLAKVRKLYA